MADFDVAVVGAGPGGYVGAIRAAQLGLRTAIVEDDNVGGVCLNWGCIPSKALLRNAEALDIIRRADEFGVSVGEISYDYGKAIDRSRDVVRRLTTGVGYLLRKNGVRRFDGRGVLQGDGAILVQSGSGGQGGDEGRRKSLAPTTSSWLRARGRGASRTFRWTAKS